MIVKIKGEVVSQNLTKDGVPILGLLIPGQEGNRDHVKIWGVKGRPQKIGAVVEMTIRINAKEMFCAEVA